MSFDVGTVLNQAIERVATSVGAIVIGGLALTGFVRTVAGQDLVRALLERLLSELRREEFREGMGPEQLEAVEEAERAIETYLAELPLAMGMQPGTATLVWLGGFVLGLAVVAVAIDAFGRRRDALDGIELGGVAWKTLNLFLGTVVFAILFLIGLALFVVPGLVVAVLLLYFPAAIVLDDRSFVGAFESSAGVVRENLPGTLGLVAVAIGAGIAVGIVGWIVGIALPAAAAAVVGELLSAVGAAFVLALIARAYASATAEDPSADPEPRRTDFA